MYILLLNVSLQKLTINNIFCVHQCSDFFAWGPSSEHHLAFCSTEVESAAHGGISGLKMCYFGLKVF